MTQQRFLVTGALGCIGAWVVRCLVREDMPVATFDLGGNPHRLRLIMDDDELARIQFIAGDVTDLALVRRMLSERVTFNGNVHTVETLIRGAVQDVQREVTEIMDAFAGSPRLIVGTGDQVGGETPDENIFAMIETVHKRSQNT